MYRNKKSKDEDELPKALRNMKRQKEREELRKTKSTHGKHGNGRRNNKKKKVDGKKYKIRKIIIIIIILAILIFGIMLGISAHTWKTIAQEMMNNQNSIVIDRVWDMKFVSHTFFNSYYD